VGIHFLLEKLSDPIVLFVFKNDATFKIII
jgi:hypothetical protein